MNVFYYYNIPRLNRDFISDNYTLIKMNRAKKNLYIKLFNCLERNIIKKKIYCHIF